MPQLIYHAVSTFRGMLREQSTFTDFIKDIWNLEKLGHLEFARQSMTERETETERGRERRGEGKEKKCLEICRGLYKIK